jgi:cell division protein FtsZ
MSESKSSVIKVIGIGDVVRGEWLTGVDFIAVDLDHSHSVPGDKYSGTKVDELRSILEETDMVFIVGRIGDTTTSSVFPLIARIAREAGSVTAAIVMTPFQFEEEAANEVSKLKENADAVIVVPGDGLLKTTSDHAPAETPFDIAGSAFNQLVNAVVSMIASPGLVSIDFEDMKCLWSESGVSVVGIGEGRGENCVSTAVYNAKNSPLLNTPINGTSGVVLSIRSSAGTRIDEIINAAKLLEEDIDEDAKFIWCHTFESDFKNRAIAIILAVIPDLVGDEV